MKNNSFLSRVWEGSKMVRERIGYGTGLPSKWKVLASVMLLLTMGIGQMWGDDLTITGYMGGSTTTGSVKIHSNTDTQTAICKFANSWSSAANFYSIKTTGGFKTGDIVNFSGAINSGKSDKYAKIVIYAADKSSKLYTSSDNVIDGNNSASDPTAESYTLTSDQDSLMFARDGNTGLFLLTLSVTRSSEPSGDPTPADVTAPTLSSSEPANGATNVAVSGNIVLTFSENVTINDASKFTISPSTGVTLSTPTVSGAAVTIPYSGLANSTIYTLSVAADAVKDGSNNKNAALSDISFTTVAAVTTGTIDDLVQIDSEFTFAPTAALTDKTLYESNKIISLGGSTYNNGIQIKNNRQLALKVAAGAKIVVTFNERSGHDRNMQIGTTSAGTDLGNSAYSPLEAVRTTAGIVYISASSDLYLTKLEIQYPYTITYDLNGGTGTTPTQASKYVGETFTAHDGVTGITAPTGKEFEKWKDQDNADVAAGATYTMPAKNVTLTAQWRNETVKYAVTYDLNGYTAGVAPTETNKAVGDVFAIKTAPSWTDHDFLGWTCNIDAQTYQASDNYTMTAAATTFTAQWQAYFTITYKDGETTLDTEKVNQGSAPVGIADPAKELKKFLGWTLVGETDLVDPASLTENTTLVAKWGDFDGCAYLAVDLTATEGLSVGDNIALKASSFGGSVKVAGMKTDKSSIAYNVNGLYLSGGGADSLRVTIGHQLQEGSKITVALRCTGTDIRGLKLLTKTGAEVAALGWTTGVKDAEATFTYEVPENSALIGEKVFRLQRNNTIYLKYISVEDCAPQDFVVTYMDGETTLGTEYVFENAHPTAADVSTRKNGFIFDGWAETAEGAVVNLNTITITTEKTLYAKYSVRDCSGIGTKFKFQLKTDLTSGNMFATAPLPATALTTEDFLSMLVGGEVEASNTNSNNNRIVIYDQKAIGLGDGGKLTLKLDCPLVEGEEIRFINYASSGNSITLSDGTNSTTLNGNNAETVQTFVVPEAWETTGAYELTMVRNEGTAKLTYFEIYRRPELTGVTLENMNLKAGNTGTPVMTLNPEGALVTSQTWEITASTATGTTIDASTGLITAGETVGEITVKVTLNGDKEATCTVKVVGGFEAPKPVTETTIWDWAPVATAENGPSILAPDTVLANYLAGEEWEMLAGNSGGRPYRSTTYKAYQGTSLYLNAAVPGILRIYAGSTGNDKKVYVNGIEVGTTGSKAYLNNIVVPSGDVYITSESMRIYWMKFDTDLSAYELTDNVLGGYERTVTEGRYGTICLPNSGVMVGAAIFEVAYRDEADAHKKIFFDEVLNGEMVAGRPYIFQPREGVTQLSVFYTDQADVEAGNYRGLFGSYTQEVLATDGTNYILLNNQYCRVANPNTSVGANRAYLKIGVDGGVPTNAVAPAPGRRRVSMSAQGEQVATGMSEEQSDNVQSAKIIIDGHMFILRGEKMYDATGRLVK